VDHDPGRVAGLKSAGAEVLIADNIDAALTELGRREVTSLFLEGGRTLASAFLAADAIDEARTFVAPILLGGGWRAGPVAGMGGLPRPARSSGGRDDAREDSRPSPPEPTGSGKPPIPAPPARRTPLSTNIETIGEDVLITARFREW